MKQLFIILIGSIAIPLVGCVTKATNDELERQVNAKRIAVAKSERDTEREIAQMDAEREEVERETKSILSSTAWGALWDLIRNLSK